MCESLKGVSRRYTLQCLRSYSEAVLVPETEGYELWLERYVFCASGAAYFYTVAVTTALFDPSKGTNSYSSSTLVIEVRKPSLTDQQKANDTECAPRRHGVEK